VSMGAEKRIGQVGGDPMVGTINW